MLILTGKLPFVYNSYDYKANLGLIEMQQFNCREIYDRIIKHSDIDNKIYFI